LIEAEVDLLVVDIAHGHSSLAIETTKTLKKEWPDVQVLFPSNPRSRKCVRLSLFLNRLSLVMFAPRRVLATSASQVPTP